MNGFKRARLIKGYTQAEVAKLLGVAPVSVSKWEAGKGLPKAKRMPEVADVLGTTVSDLLNESEGRADRGEVAQCG